MRYSKDLPICTSVLDPVKVMAGGSRAKRYRLHNADVAGELQNAAGSSIMVEAVGHDGVEMVMKKD